MKRQKLIDDIQKFIDKKRRKYFIIKLILAFYFLIFAISIIKLRILDYRNSFLLSNFIFIVIVGNIALVIAHFKKKYFNFRKIANLFNEAELEELYNKITALYDIHGNSVSMILTERYLVMVGKKCNAILLSEIDSISKKYFSVYYLEKIIIKVGYINNTCYIRNDKESLQILETLKDIIKANVKKEKVVDTREEIIDKMIKDIAIKKEKSGLYNINNEMDNKKNKGVFILILLSVLSLATINTIKISKYIFITSCSRLLICIFTYWKYRDFYSKNETESSYIYYDVNEILPKLSDEDVRLLYEQILNLPELTQDGVIFFVNDKIIRLGDKQYCISWDKIITIQYTLSNDNMACVRLAFSDDEKTVNKLELYSDMFVFSEEEYEKKCRQYKIEYKFTRAGMNKDIREFQEKLNDRQ